MLNMYHICSAGFSYIQLLCPLGFFSHHSLNIFLLKAVEDTSGLFFNFHTPALELAVSPKKPHNL